MTPENVLNIYSALIKMGKEQGCEAAVLKLFENKFVEKFIEEMGKNMAAQKSEDDEKIEMETAKERFLKNFKHCLPTELYNQILELKYTPGKFQENSFIDPSLTLEGVKLLPQNEIFTVLQDKYGIQGKIYHSTIDYEPYLFEIIDKETSYWFEKEDDEQDYRLGLHDL